MTAYFDSCENGANSIIANVGKSIVIAVPLGIGKPVGLLNALFKLALNDASIKLTIITALTLARPSFKSELEKRFAEPILQRLLQDYEDPLYEQCRVSQSLPDNINVIEFFLTPGKFLRNDYVQQNYINSSYTNVNRDVMSLSVNVLAQQVSPSSKTTNLYSLSCNTDLFNDLRALMKKSASSTNKIAIVAEVNANLPFMYGTEAEVDDRIFTDIIDTKQYRTIFAVPRDELSIADHMIGLYTSALIKDGGCLQLGIGKLSNALANALIYRHKDNASYSAVLNQLKLNEKFAASVSKSGSLSSFEKGLYGSTEMLSDAYIQLYKENILKKRVYDHVGLQKLLNEGLISEAITPATINILIEHQVIHAKLTAEDVKFIRFFGILKQDVTFQDNNLILSSGETILADYTAPSTRQEIIDKCLGDKLISGKIIHAGFFFGSVELYTTLKTLPIDELKLFEMTNIARTNALSWSPELLTLQRQHARFVNDCLMVTALGVIISDGLSDYKELSGVGGQYDFVSMANQLQGAHSIINCHSTRKSKQGVNSNIVWDYTNSTIPRFLRDYVVTEYGIADCRSKTDADIIKAILNITDSRFQQTLLKQAKKSGKLPRDYSIPELFQNNYPDVIEAIIKPLQQKGYFKPYPFGSDLTHDEQTLARVLLVLQNASLLKLLKLIIISLFFFKKDAHFNHYLQRMQLKSVRNVKDYVYKKLIKYLLYRDEKKCLN